MHWITETIIAIQIDGYCKRGNFRVGVIYAFVTLLTLRTVLVQILEFCVVICIFDDFIKRWLYFNGKSYINY